MPAKPPKPETETFRSILFRGDDNANVEAVQAKLRRLDPARRSVTISDAVRYALAMASSRS